MCKGCCSMATRLCEKKSQSAQLTGTSLIYEVSSILKKLRASFRLVVKSEIF